MPTVMELFPFLLDGETGGGILGRCHPEEGVELRRGGVKTPFSSWEGFSETR